MDFSTRFLPPNAFDDNPPVCDECAADREDCGPDCKKMAQWLKEREEEERQAETDHPMHDRDRLLDERFEREI